MLPATRLRCLEGDYLLLEMKRDSQSEDKQLPPYSLLNYYLSLFFFSVREKFKQRIYEIQSQLRQYTLRDVFQDVCRQ